MQRTLKVGPSFPLLISWHSSRSGMEAGEKRWLVMIFIRRGTSWASRCIFCGTVQLVEGYGDEPV